MQCTKCDFIGVLSRTKRAGLLEEHVFSLFGYFPWVCSLCKNRTMLKNRGERRRAPRQVESAPTAAIQAKEDGLHHSG